MEQTGKPASYETHERNMESGEKPGESVTVIPRMESYAAVESDTWTYTVVFAGTENDAFWIRSAAGRGQVLYTRKRKADMVFFGVW